MYNINNRNINDKYELYQFVNDETILSYYLGIDLDKDVIWITSPFRPHEKDRSFRVSYHENRWVWTDFGRSQYPQDSITFVMQFYGLTYPKALTKIYNDIHLNSSVTFIPNISYNNKEVIASCNLQNLKPFEYDYFKSASIDDKDLKYFKVFGGIIRNNGIVVHISTELDPYFIYMFDIKSEIYKGYRPYSPNIKGKFYSHNIANHIQGYDLLPKNGNILIITKSYKDVMVWSKLGYPAIAPHTESCFIEETMLSELKSRFKYIYVNFDNDNTGVSKSIEFTNKNNLLYFNLPKSTNTKDPFEFVTKLDYTKLNMLFNNKLKRDAINI